MNKKQRDKKNYIKKNQKRKKNMNCYYKKE